MLLHTFPATETTTTNPPLASGYALTPHKWENSPVHTNSYALIVADLTLTDTTIETLRALRAGAHRTNAYGPDCDEGDGCRSRGETDQVCLTVRLFMDVCILQPLGQEITII